MAKAIRRLQVEMRLGMAEIQKDVRRANATLKSELGKINTKINIGIAVAGAAVAASAIKGLVQGIQEMADAGENAADIRDQFLAIGGTASEIDKAKVATLGLVDSFDLMQIANRGLIRDIPAFNENFGKIAELAQRLSSALGIDTKEALDKVTAALASGKQKQLEAVRLWGDSEGAVKRYQAAHGLLGAELTKQQKKIAMQEEAIRRLDSAINSLAADGDSASTAYSAFSVSLGEAYKEMGIGIDSSEQLTQAWRELQLAVDSVDWEAVGRNIANLISLITNLTSAALPTLTKWFNGISIGLDVMFGQGRNKQIYDLLQERKKLTEALTTRDIIGGRWETFGKRPEDMNRWLQELDAVNNKLKEVVETGKEEKRLNEENAKKNLEQARQRAASINEETSRKGEAALKKEAEAAENARKEQEKLTQAWQKRISTLDIDILKDQIDLAISSRNAPEFERLLNEYRKALFQAVGEDLTREFGKTWPEGAKLFQKITVDRGIMPSVDKWEDEMQKANTEIADDAAQKYADAAAFWTDTFRDAVTGQMFSLENAMERLGVGFAGAVAAGITGGVGEGIKSLEDAGKLLGEKILENFFGATRDENNNLIVPAGNSGYASALMGVIGVGSSAMNIESLNKQNNSEAGTGATAGTAVGAVAGYVLGSAGTIGGPMGTAIGMVIGNVLGQLIGDQISKGVNTDAQARHAFAGFMEDQLGQYFTFAMRNAEGKLEMVKGEGIDFLQGSSWMFSGEGGGLLPGTDWVGEMEKWGATAQATFIGLGEALEEVAGITENTGGQFAFLLGTQLSGDINNARLLVQMLGVDLETMMQGLETAAMQGEMRWAEYNVAVQGINEAYKEGLVEVGAYALALEDLANSGGRGISAVASLRNIAIEAMEAGVTSIDELQQKLIESGADPEWVNSLMTAIRNAGVQSLEEWAQLSDTAAGTIVGNMEAISATIQQQWVDMSAKIDELNNKLAEIPEELPVKIRITVEDPDNGLSLANGGSETATAGANGMVVPFKSGGIVSKPTFFRFANGGRLGLMGEAGPEAILPLKKVNGQLGVQADVSGAAGGNVVINVDARGAGRGVETDILSALESMEQRIVARAVSAIVDGSSRGYF